MISKFKIGFTLIEILVTIAIMAITATIGLTSYPGMLARARDGQRLDDARRLVGVLQQFYGEKGRYPGNGGVAQYNASWVNSTGGSSWIPELVADYLPSVPTDPRNGQPLYYEYTSSPTDYCLQVPQERDASRHRNYKSGTDPWKLRFGPYGPNGGLCQAR